MTSINNLNDLNNNNVNNNASLCPPSWQVLALLCDHLDPKTLAIASCVSKSWLLCLSSDYLWDSFCSAEFPSIAPIKTTVDVPRRRLYAIAYAASRLRNRLPRKPNLSLDNLLFAITIRSGGFSNNNNGHVITIVKPCKELRRDPHGTFRFEVDVEDDRDWSVDEVEGVRVTWHVVDTEWKAVFAMAEESGAKKGGFSSSADGWFSEELPTPWCCSGGMSSGLVADLRVEMVPVTGVGAVENGGSGKMRIEKVKVGVMSVINWRYLSVDDALSYLDHFLYV